MDTHKIIDRNFAWCPDYDEKSFSGQLHENAHWSDDEYWLLEWALYKLAEAPIASQELNWRIFRIFSHTFLTFGCHFDRNDVYKIENLKRAQVYELRERFQLVFEGFFSKDMPTQDCFEIPNPLLGSVGD